MEFFKICLKPDGAGLIEAFGLACIVIFGRKFLDTPVSERGLGIAIVVFYGAGSVGSHANGVHRVDRFLCDVDRKAHVLKAGFLGHGLEDIRVFAGKSGHFDAIDSSVFPFAHDGGSILRAVEAGISGRAAPERIDVETWRDDFVVGAALLFGHHLLGRHVVNIEGADRCDTVTEEEFVLVIERRIVSEVHVHVDEAGHDIHAFGFDHVAVGGRFRVWAEHATARDGV